MKARRQSATSSSASHLVDSASHLVLHRFLCVTSRAIRWRRSTLVIVMAGEHRQAVLREAPRLMKRTYTLKELARLIESAGERQP